MDEAERKAREEKLANRLAEAVKNAPKSEVERVEKRRDEILQALLDCEPLPELTIKPIETLALLSALHDSLNNDDYHKFVLILSMMYGIEDDNEFMKRVAKTLLTLEVPDEDDTDHSEPENP